MSKRDIPVTHRTNCGIAYLFPKVFFDIIAIIRSRELIFQLLATS